MASSHLRCRISVRPGRQGAFLPAAVTAVAAAAPVLACPLAARTVHAATVWAAPGTDRVLGRWTSSRTASTASSRPARSAGVCRHTARRGFAIRRGCTGRGTWGRPVTPGNIGVAYSLRGPGPARVYLLPGVDSGTGLSVVTVAAACGYQRSVAPKRVGPLVEDMPARADSRRGRCVRRTYGPGLETPGPRLMAGPFATTSQPAATCAGDGR